MRMVEMIQLLETYMLMEGRKGSPVGTKSVWGGRAMVKTSSGWVPDGANKGGGGASPRSTAAVPTKAPSAPPPSKHSGDADKGEVGAGNAEGMASQIKHSVDLVQSGADVIANPRSSQRTAHDAMIGILNHVDRAEHAIEIATQGAEYARKSGHGPSVERAKKGATSAMQSFDKMRTIHQKALADYEGRFGKFKDPNG